MFCIVEHIEEDEKIQFTYFTFKSLMKRTPIRKFTIDDDYDVYRMIQTNPPVCSLMIESKSDIKDMELAFVYFPTNSPLKEVWHRMPLKNYDKFT